MCFSAQESWGGLRNEDLGRFLAHVLTRKETIPSRLLNQGEMLFLKKMNKEDEVVCGVKRK